MRLLSLVSTLFILLFACSAVAEEGLERYLPSDAIAERGKWDTDIILEAGSHTPLEVEELIVNEARVRYTHSLNASMLMKLPFELEERFEGSAHDVLDMMCKRTALSCFLDDDGTMLVTSDLEGREIADIPVRKHFGEPLSTPMRLGEWSFLTIGR
ncbi:MAG: hypothetical protein U5N86_11840 [Planctomycetota bacterium]|nr:hypothetical protein [Planctomycetota bacterium]